MSYGGKAQKNKISGTHFPDLSLSSQIHSSLFFFLFFFFLFCFSLFCFFISSSQLHQRPEFFFFFFSCSSFFFTAPPTARFLFSSYLGYRSNTQTQTHDHIHPPKNVQISSFFFFQNNTNFQKNLLVSTFQNYLKN